MLGKRVILGAILIGLAGPLCAGFSDNKPEEAPIIERNLEFRELMLKTVEGAPFTLRDFARNKRLIIVHYFAGWCPNSIQNGHVLKRLYDKYHDRGLGMVSIAEYSTPDELRIYVNRIGLENPVLVETQSRDDRKKSAHYKYRVSTGDKRRWGTPFYVMIDARDFIDPAGNPAEGSLLARRVFTVSGEMIETEAQQFIERALSTAN